MPPPPVPPSSEALLRYSVLAQMEALILGGWGAEAAVREVAGREHAHPDGRVVRVSQRTIQRWRTAYREGGIGGLEPASRKRTDTSVVLDEEFVAFLKAENKRDPRASAAISRSASSNNRKTLALSNGQCDIVFLLFMV